MATTMFVTVICAVLGSSAGFGFIQFLIQRRDTKRDKIDEIVNDINEIKKNVVDLTDSVAKINAINARTRILRSADELRLGMKHSKEYFDQLNDDITSYENYCNINTNFRNNQAVLAIEYINDIYSERLHHNDFL